MDNIIKYGFEIVNIGAWIYFRGSNYDLFYELYNNLAKIDTYEKKNSTDYRKYKWYCKSICKKGYNIVFNGLEKNGPGIALEVA